MSKTKTTATQAEEVKNEELPEIPAEAGTSDVAESPSEEAAEKPKEIPAKITVKTRDGYSIVGRKPTFGDRRWMFIQPESMGNVKLPSNEVMASACIEEIIGPDGKKVLLNPELHPWFHLAEMGMEAPLVYVAVWNETYMPSQQDMLQGILYAMDQMNQGNA